MPYRMISAVFAVLFFISALSGCATQQPAAPVQAAAEAPAEPAFEPFHDIVDMAFVAEPTG